jgi:hypothetical protein
MTAIVAQYINSRIHVLEEIYLRNSNTVEMCEQFEQRAASYFRTLHRHQRAIMTLARFVFWIGIACGVENEPRHGMPSSPGETAKI